MKLRQNLRLLYSLGSVATLLGLIGTIWGMIKAFEVASVQGPGHVQALSEGIYAAMGRNTFAGTPAIAIVVTIFYYYFAGHIEKLVVEMNETVNEFGRDVGFDESPAQAEAAAGVSKGPAPAQEDPCESGMYKARQRSRSILFHSWTWRSIC